MFVTSLKFPASNLRSRPCRRNPHTEFTHKTCLKSAPRLGLEPRGCVPRKPPSKQAPQKSLNLQKRFKLQTKDDRSLRSIPALRRSPFPRPSSTTTHFHFIIKSERERKRERMANTNNHNHADDGATPSKPPPFTTSPFSD
jgi:hypothetical protein